MGSSSTANTESGVAGGVDPGDERLPVTALAGVGTPKRATSPAVDESRTKDKGGGRDIRFGLVPLCCDWLWVRTWSGRFSSMTGDSATSLGTGAVSCFPSERANDSANMASFALSSARSMTGSPIAKGNSNQKVEPDPF